MAISAARDSASAMAISFVASIFRIRQELFHELGDVPLNPVAIEDAQRVEMQEHVRRRRESEPDDLAISQSRVVTGHGAYSPSGYVSASSRTHRWRTLGFALIQAERGGTMCIAVVSLPMKVSLTSTTAAQLGSMAA